MKFILFCILFFYSFCFFGQNASIKFNRISIEQGLSQTVINHIIQDSKGFIWIATQDGLNRYDGYNFKHYKKEENNNTSLTNNYINYLFEDKNHVLWVGTKHGLNGINLIDQHVIHINESNSNGFKGGNVLAITEDYRGRLFVAIKNEGIYVLNKKRQLVHKIGKFDGLKTTQIKNLKRDDLGRIWVMYEREGIDFLYEDDFSIETVISGKKQAITVYDVKKSILEDYVVATSNGVYRIKGEKNDTLKVLSQNLNKRLTNVPVTGVYFQVKESNKFWFSTEGKGLFYYENSDGKEIIKNYTHNPVSVHSLVSNNIGCLFQDYSGNLWLGTNHGIAKFDLYKEGFNHITIHIDPAKGLNDKNVWSFTELDSTQVIIGTSSGISIFNRLQGSFRHIELDQFQKDGYCAVFNTEVISHNHFLLSTSNGVFEVHLSADSQRIKRVIFDQNTKLNNYSSVYDIKAIGQNTFLLTFAKGLSVYNIKTKQSKVYTPANSDLIRGDGKVLYHEKDNEFWLATYAGKLQKLVISNTGEIQFLKANTTQLKHKLSGFINSITQSSSGNLWLGTYGDGLFDYNIKTGHITVYDKDHNLANPVIYGLINENDKRIWMSTNQGISCFNIQTSLFENFNSSDGLQSNEFNSNAYLKTQSGELYFGGVEGFNSFYPNKIKRNPIAPKPIISNVFVQNKRMKPGKESNMKRDIVYASEIELPSFKNNISFHFSGMHFSNPNKNAYKFRLIGLEEKWHFVGTENHANYANIPPGKYIFELYAANSDGVWSYQGAKLKISVRYPFYMTWWFRIGASVFLILFILILYRRRVENIRRQKVLLELEVVERTREIRLQNKKIEEQNRQVEIQKLKIIEQKKLIEIEKENAEQLLNNILPMETATELQLRGRYEPRSYRVVSVMFTDFVKFSKIAESTPPKILVETLDRYFTKFDSFIDTYNLEKIKTMGDAYMCAGGLPIRNKSNPIEIVLAGLKIQQYMKELKEKALKNNEDHWELRLGINTGDVIAGVIGSKRFAYDIWGTSVNQAQRMEMYGMPGKVNISGNTFDLVEPYFECVYRGKIQIKHKGLLDMYFVEGIKPALSIDGLGLEPNDAFWKIVNLHLFSDINYTKAERHIMKLLEENLSPTLHYHSIAHTKDVTRAVERLAIMEGITDEDLFLLKSAASYHDAGFVEEYDKNEPVGVRMAQEILPHYGYTDEQINIIAELILVTAIPHQPKNLLEKIICDADLDYLGRDDFHPISDKLKKELLEHKKIESSKQWDEIQLKFLNTHQYFTQSAIKLRQTKKNQHVLEIKNRLKQGDYTD